MKVNSTMHEASDESRKVDYSAFPLWVKLIVAATFINWGVNFAAAVKIGGDALGTRPTPGRYYVTSHGAESDVTEGTWVVSLAHTYVSFMLFMGMAWSLVPYFPRAMRGPMRKMKPGAVKVFKVVMLTFLSIWTALGIICTHADLIKSLLAYSHLH